MSDLEPEFAKSMQDLHHDKRGREIPDPNPMAPPVGYKRSPTISDRIREMIRSENLQREALAAGAETFEEANDFDDPEEGPISIYEFDEDAELELREAQAAAAAQSAQGQAEGASKAAKAASPPTKKAAPKGADHAAGAADSDEGASQQSTT